MMNTVRGLALAILVLAVPSLTQAQGVAPEKRADIERLLELTGALSLGKQMAVSVAAQFGQALRKARPDIPQQLIEALPVEIEAVFSANMPSFTAQVIPLYDKYFTGEEIKQMIAFYSSDLGRKTISVMPSLLQESMAIGQKWGQSLAPEIDARVRARFKKEGIQI